MHTTLFDAAVIGGSYAGISAALQLARGHRRVAVIDAGQRRNRFASHAHGFVGQDGRPPGEIFEDARDQLLRYPTVTWIEANAQSVRGRADDFELVTEAGTTRARRLVLASGVTDHLPEVPGLRQRWGRSVFHCPYCHGYELGRGAAIGVLATGPMSIHQAQLLTDWGVVTLFLNGAFTPGQEEAADLARRGVRIETAHVRQLIGNVQVELEDGRHIALAGLFTASRTEPQASALAEQLGCGFEEGPLGRFIRTGPVKETCVPGVFACGDAARAAGNVALAVGDGALCGAGVHRSLVFESSDGAAAVRPAMPSASNS